LTILRPIAAGLEADPAEWRAFDECCHITISRFFRDQGVFEVLRERVLPDIATRVVHEKRAGRIWSAGCASGEEPYTLKIIFDREVACSVSGAPASIVATDIDETVLARSLLCRAAIGDLQDIVRAIKARGASLKATEQPIDTSTAAGKCLLDMLGVFAEFETNLHREWQLEGIAKAKAAGVYKGRPASIDAAQVRQMKAQGVKASGYRQSAWHWTCERLRHRLCNRG
jgi:CheR methyltransferase, SAM binding domain/Resolvase, N terminal domain